MRSEKIDSNEEMNIIAEVEIGDSNLMLYQKTKTPETFWVRGSFWRDEIPRYSSERFDDFERAEAFYHAVVKKMAEPEMERLRARLSRGQTSTFVEDFAELVRLNLEAGELDDGGLHRIIGELRLKIEPVSEPVN